VSENVSAGGEPLLLRDVKDRLPTVDIADDEGSRIVGGLHRRSDPARFGSRDRLVAVANRRGGDRVTGVLQPEPIERRPAAREEEQFIGIDCFVPSVAFDVEAHPIGRGLNRLLVRFGQHFDPEFLAVDVEERVAEGGIGLVKRARVVFDHGEVHPTRLAQVGHHLDPDVAEAHHDPSIRELRTVEHVRASHVLALVDSGDFGDVHGRAGGDHGVVSLDLAIADRDGVIVDEPRGLVEKFDVLALSEVVDRTPAVGREVRRVLVFRLDHRIEIDLGE
jgi:hypothetical protein